MNVMTNTRRNFLAGAGAAGLLATTMIRPARAQSATDNSLSSLWKDMELIDADGDSFSIAEGRKPLTLIKLWANWCPVCVGEVAALDRLVTAVGPQKLDVILISHPSWFAGDQATAQSRGVRYKLATPARSNGRERIQAALMNAEGMYAVPRSMVFAKAGGEVVAAHQGGMDWTNATMVAQLRNAAVA